MAGEAAERNHRIDARPRARSGYGISAIFASTALSSSASPERRPPRLAALLDRGPFLVRESL
jgi:hypothetical protein